MNSGQEKLIHVVQGEFIISSQPNDVLTTVLGSCISVCLFDRNRRIGGINHFLLSSRDGQDSNDMRYGANAMELLINGLLRQGGERHRLQAKVFGGARMCGNLSNIGQANTMFARQYLQDEGIPCLAESTGGRAARRIRFWPTTGKVRQLIIPERADPVEMTKKSGVVPAAHDDIVLF